MANVRDLPEYKKPPVVEVAIGVHFKPLNKFTTAYFGSFWSLHKKAYPKVEDQPPILELVQPELVTLPPLRRVWFQEPDGGYLIQLQSDLFILNWRKVSEDSAYVRFAEIKKRFYEAWASFKDFVKAENLGAIETTRYEVTYVNQIAEAPNSFPAALARYSHLITLRESNSDYFLPEPSAVSADIQFKIPDGRGTLRVVFKHGTRPNDGGDVMQVDLAATMGAKPDESDLDEWLEVAHTWIVQGFTDLTSREAQARWERIR